MGSIVKLNGGRFRHLKINKNNGEIFKIEQIPPHYFYNSPQHSIDGL
jgi:hypothetical protein